MAGEQTDGPVVVSSSKATAERIAVAGMPGVYVVVVTLPDAAVLRWVEFEGKAAEVVRLPGG